MSANPVFRLPDWSDVFSSIVPIPVQCGTYCDDEILRAASLCFVDRCITKISTKKTRPRFVDSFPILFFLSV